MISASLPLILALEQIKAQDYARKYQEDGRPIYLVGIDFDANARNLAGFACERG